MKANLAQREPAMLQNWQKLDLYKRIAEKNSGKPKFVLHDGPPYANGELHLPSDEVPFVKSSATSEYLPPT